MNSFEYSGPWASKNLGNLLQLRKKLQLKASYSSNVLSSFESHQIAIIVGQISHHLPLIFQHTKKLSKTQIRFSLFRPEKGFLAVFLNVNIFFGEKYQNYHNFLKDHSCVITANELLIVLRKCQKLLGLIVF